MARWRPSTIKGFLRVNGVGQIKCEEFGDAFVLAIKNYCLKHSLETDLVRGAI
jgi:superfamily II DNA helicase RecQ